MAITKQDLEERIKYHEDRYHEILAIAEKAGRVPVSSTYLGKWPEGKVRPPDLTLEESKQCKFHLSEELVLRNRLWDEFLEPEWKAENREAETNKLLDEIRALPGE
jgi:hypothetical protein